MLLNRDAVLSALTEWRSTQKISILTCYGKVMEIYIRIGSCKVSDFIFLFADFPQLEDDYIILSYSSNCSLSDGSGLFERTEPTSVSFYRFFFDNLTAVENYFNFSTVPFSMLDKRIFRSRDARVFVTVNDYNILKSNPLYSSVF